jgi:hypothetical protein
LRASPRHEPTSSLEQAPLSRRFPFGWDKGLTVMAFDGALLGLTTPPSEASLVPWRRDERLVVLVGGAALGAMAGFVAALWSGRVEIWTLALIAAPVLALDLHLTSLTLADAFRRRAHGCAIACALHALAVLGWPMAALAAALTAPAFWIAPALALTALVLFASCWRGESGALYRMGAQAALVAALMAQQGVFVALGA